MFVKQATGYAFVSAQGFGTNMTDSTTQSNTVTSWKAALPVLLTLLIWIGIAQFSHLRYAPPAVSEMNPLKSEFCAIRAEPIFERLYRDAKPHPAGDNQWFRDKVIAEFDRLGYQVELQKTSSPVLNGRSSDQTVQIVNLIVRLVGKTDKPPVMLAAHYDSVPSGPGAADDGAGLTALIEIARILRDQGPLDRTVVFLLTDGEEFGLLGARKFVEQHPLADQVAAVINLEARGTSGPSLMFETSDDSHWLSRLFARTAKRPFTSSLFFEIYRFLPNDTDFTVFRLHGMKGFNFAFIGDVKNYHSGNDNFQTLDRRSLQHHGENALPLLRELANSDIESQSNRPGVYFDVFGYFVIHWPAWVSVWMAGLAAMIVFRFSIWRQMLEKQESLASGVTENANPSTALSVGMVTAAIILLAIVGKLVDVGWRFDGAFEFPWPENALPIQASFWTFALTALLAMTWLVHRRLTWRAVWFGVWLIWSALAVSSAIYLPGASYLFIVPLLVTALACSAAIYVGGKNLVTSAAAVTCAGAIATGLIWLPLERLFYDALGFRMNVTIIFRVAIVLTSLLPATALASRRSIAVLAVASLSASVAISLWAALA